jgi:hypothetical protein
MAEHIDEALIDIRPDFSTFNQRVRDHLAELRLEDVGLVDLKARLNTQEVEREINRLAGQSRRVVTLQAKVDDLQAKADLAWLGTNRKTQLTIDLQAAKARLELADITRGKNANLNVELQGVAAAKAALLSLATEAHKVKLGDQAFNVEQTGTNLQNQIGKLDVKDINQGKQNVVIVQAKIDDAQARMKLAELNRDSTKVIHIRGEIEGFRRDLLEAENALDRTEKEDAARRGKGFGFLGSAGAVNLIQGPLIAAGLAAITPLSGAVLGLASAFAVAGGASAVFGVAAVGHLAQITTVMKQVKEQGQQLADLPAPFQTFLPEVTKFQNTWALFLQNTRAPVFDTFIAAMNVIKPLLNELVPVVNTVSVGLSHAFVGLQGFTQGKEVQDFLNMLKTDGPSAINTLIASATNLSAGLLAIFTDFMPSGQAMLAFIEQLTGRFREWASNLSVDPAFQDFLAYSVQYGPKVLDVIVNLAVALGKIVVALGPIGGVVIEALQAITKLLAIMPVGVWTAISFGVAIWGVSLVTNSVKVAAAMKTATKAMEEFKIAQALLGGGFSGGALASANALGVGLQKVGTNVKGLLSSYGTLGLVVGVAALGLDIWSTKNKEAADLVELHRSRVQGLADQMRAAGAEAGSSAFLQDTIKALEDTKVALSWFERPNPLTALWSAAPAEGLTEAATKAGLSLKVLAAGAAGDATAFKQSTVAWQGYIDSLKQQASKSNDNNQIDQLNTEATLQQKALDTYKAMSVSKEAAIAVNDRLKAAGLAPMYDAEGNAIQGVTTILDQYNLAKQAALGLGTSEGQMNADILKSYQAVTDAVAAQAKAITDAAKANASADRSVASAKRAVNDANDGIIASEKAVVDALYRSAQATKATSEAVISLQTAREEAARKLRDSLDTEESNSINLARARENLAKVNADVTSTDLDKRQAALDYKNAQEDYNDSVHDGAKLRAGGVENEPGVRGARKTLADDRKAEADASAAVVQARKDETKANQRAKDATTALNDAEQNRTDTLAAGKASVAAARKATQDATSAYGAAKTALDKVAGAAGISKDKLKGLHTELEKQLKLDTGNVPKQLDDMARGFEALRLMKSDPTLSWGDAWKYAAKVPGKASPTGGARPYDPSMLGPSPVFGPPIPKHALGGPIYGPAGADSILSYLTAGEHIWTPEEVAAAGGHGAMARMRKAALAHEPPRYTATAETTARSSGGNSRTENAITVNQTINNPIPERASNSGPKGLRRAANQLGRS